MSNLCREMGSSTPTEGTCGEETFAGGTVQNTVDHPDQLPSHDQDGREGVVTVSLLGQFEHFESSIFVNGEYK